MPQVAVSTCLERIDKSLLYQSGNGSHWDKY